MGPQQRPAPARDAAQGRLIVLTAVLFVSYLCVALSLPVVPLFVAGDLGMGNVWA
ncbi:arabinose transporter, partial [Azospirillum brasilense]|nr:arabinose transporter [Azospirillum brasilense]